MNSEFNGVTEEWKRELLRLVKEHRTCDAHKAPAPTQQHRRSLPPSPGSMALDGTRRQRNRCDENVMKMAGFLWCTYARREVALTLHMRLPTRVCASQHVTTNLRHLYAA